MFYIIDIAYLPDELIKEIETYLPSKAEGFLFIRKDGLGIFTSYRLFLDEGYEFIDIEKLKELLILKRLKE